MFPDAPRIVFDNAVTGEALCFGDPIRVIQADVPDRVPEGLAEMQAALGKGLYLAGFFSYELGYALERRLARFLPHGLGVPLLWFAVFSNPPRRAVGASLWRNGHAEAGPIRWEWSEADYGRRFDRVAEWIKAGDIYQANLSMRGRFRFTGEPRALFRDLREQAGAAHGAYIDTGRFQILSVSPELLFDLASDGTLTTRPMKGTAARRPDPAEDAAARRALAGSEKERAENLMIVDLLRNDLTRIAEIPSVRTTGLFEIETYPTVHQMVSTVTARLRGKPPVERILEALFPCGSITGAPKIRAMEIIAELEESRRGAYCGAIGHFAPDGAARFNVAIRTVTLAGNRGELGVGGAIVAESTRAGEYAECLLKARYFEAARHEHIVADLELISAARPVDKSRNGISKWKDSPVSHSELLDQYSLEITVKDIPALKAVNGNIPAGTAISVTYLNHEAASSRIAAAVAARQFRLDPVPHLAARRLRSAEDLAAQLASFRAEAAVDRVFVIAGDVATIDGPYADSLALIRSGLLESAGIRAVGIGGYPDGHPKIPPAELWTSLHAKTRALREVGLECEIVTQFGFDPDAVLGWLARLRQEGITVPVRIGLPGPANIPTLLRFAAVCGVATSAKVMAKYGLSMSRLIGSAGPDRFVDALREKLSPALHGEVRVHLYPFGGLVRAVDWVGTYREAQLRHRAQGKMN